MKAKFDDLVKNLANKRVQDRVVAFNKEIRQAIQRLSPIFPQYSVPILVKNGGDTTSAPLMFNQQLISFLTGESKELPQEIWGLEEQAVSKELLATMDVMQQAIAAGQSKIENIATGK